MNFFGAAYALGLTIAMGLLVAGGSFVLARVVNGCRHKILWFAGRHYNTVEKIAAVSHPSVKEALVAGVSSKHWKGYLRSFLNYKTITNYGAYAAGYYAKMHGYKAETEAIKKFKP